MRIIIMKSFQGVIFVALAAFVAADSHGRPTCPVHQMTVYRKPYLGDCTKYWECFQGASYVVSCPPGLEFNAPMMQCDTPELAKCDHSPSTSSSPDTTSETPRTSWTPDPSCPSEPDVIYYFNYPGDCNKFYECYGGRKYVRQCPAGLYWNEPISRCDYPENVHSCDDVPSTTHPYPPTTEPTPAPTTRTTEPTPAPTTRTTEPTTASHTTTTVPPRTTQYPPDKCPYSDIAKYYPYPSDWTKFYLCYKGTRHLYSCPGHSHWNQARLACVRIENILIANTDLD